MRGRRGSAASSGGQLNEDWIQFCLSPGPEAAQGHTLCHLVERVQSGKELRKLDPGGCDTYKVVQFPAFLQVEILNMSTVNPININGASVQGQTLLEVGDTIEVLGHRFVWQRQEQQESQNIPDSDLEASYQIGEYSLDASRCIGI